MKSHKTRKQPLRHIRHSLTMVRRNIRVYMKLSVTVVISFSLLLGFLVFTDAQLYNKYKELFAQPREVVLCYNHGTPAAYHALLAQIERDIPDADSYGYVAIDGISEYENGKVNAMCSFLPAGGVPVYTWGALDLGHDLYYPNPVRLIGEKQGFDVKGNEVIINESWYKALTEEGATEAVRIPIHFNWQDGKSVDWELSVIGVCEDTAQDVVRTDKTGFEMNYGHVYLSAELLSRADAGEFSAVEEYWVWANTTAPEKVISYARALEFVPYSVVEAQDAANTVLKIEKTSKAYIAAIILVLLSINLYSSFSNALQERRYEIGVKRAIGASKMHIVRQFLYESLCVLLFDTVLATALVFDIMIGYKTYQAFVLGKEWIIYASSYSVMMFLVCSLSLSVVFSLIFAFRSMQVEIISNLRNE